MTNLRLVKPLSGVPSRTGSVDKDRVINYRLDSLVRCQDSYVLCPPVPKLRSVLYGECPPMLPISIPLPRFSDNDFVASYVWSSSVPTQQCPSSPKSRASTVCIDINAFGLECSRSGDCQPSVSPGAVDRQGVSSVDICDYAQSDVSMVLSRFQPLNQPHSPVDMSSDSQIVVESPTLYDTPAEPLDMSTVVDRVAQVSQASGLSSVQLSTNRVCEDYMYDTLDVFPVFQVSPDAEGYYPDTSPVMHRNVPKNHWTHWFTVLYRWKQLGRSTASLGVW